MADRQNAIGILFGVEGGGDINHGSGELIKNSISEIVRALERDSSTKIKFTIDVDELKKQMSEMTQDVTKTIDKLKKDIDQIISSTSGGKSGGKKSGKNGGTNSQVYKDAVKYVKEYHQWLLKVQKAMTRTNDITLELDGYDIKQIKAVPGSEWEPLVERMEEAKIKYDEAKKAAESFSDEQDAAFNAAKHTIELQHDISQHAADASGAESWAKLSANVNKYIDDVEYAASRSPEMAKKLEALRELANTGNMSNYDELRRQWRAVEHEIDSAGLSVETFGQKVAKAIGGKLRDAIAGFFAVKIGQSLTEIYNNVVKLDEAVTNLQIATGKNREEVKKLVKEYSSLAKQLGATTAEVAAGADTWLRQGLSESDTEEMIKNTMMLSKLGQMESAEAAEALTSAMKGYNIAVSDAVSIVDKWTAVDMEAAANAGDMATAMSETAASAGLAGIEMDKLIGYITVVKEVTQDGAESVGTFYRTLFARMNNVKAGKFIDDETGEALNDVEKVLGELGVSLRDTNGLFRNSGEVLDEVASKWGTYNNVQQHAIATAFAGTKQQEKFLVLMQNYGTATEYATIASESAGTAVEKFGAHTESIQGKMASLTASFERLSQSVLDSGLIVGFVELLTKLVEFASIGSALPARIALVVAGIVALVGATQALVTATQRLNTALNAPTTGLVTYIKHVWSLVASQGAAKVATDEHTKSLVKNYTTGVSGVLTFIPRAIAAIGMWAASLIKAKFSTDLMTTSSITLKAALDALNVNPVVLAITALVAVGAGLVAINKKAAKSAEEAAQKAEEYVQQMKEAANAEREESEELDALIDRYKELRNSEFISADARVEIREIQKQINKLVKEESNSWDAINDSIEDSVKHLQNFRNQQYAEDLSKSRESYKIQYDKAKSAKHQSRDQYTPWYYWHRLGIRDLEYDLDDFDLVVDGWDQQAASILKGVEGVSEAVSKLGSTAVQFEKTDAFGYAETIQSAIDALENAPGYNAIDSDVVAGLIELKEKYSTYVDSVQSEFDGLLESTIRNELAALETDGIDIHTVDDYEAIREKLLESVMSDEWIGAAVSEGILASDKSIINEVYSYFDSQYGHIFDRLAADISKQSPSMMIESIKDKFDLVSDALTEMAEDGRLSAGTVSEIFDPENGFEDVQKYVKMTSDGWVMELNALSQLMEEKRAQFVSIIDELRDKNILERDADDIAADKNYAEAQIKFLKELEAVTTDQATLNKIRTQILEAEAALADFEDQEALSNAISNLKQFDVVWKTLTGSAEVAGESAKTFIDILDGVEGPYNAIVSAMEDMDKLDILSNDTLREILDPENGFPELAKYLIQTADGYKMQKNALEDFIAAKIKEYEAIRDASAAGTEAYEKACQELEWLNIAFATLSAAEKEVVDGLKTLEDILNEVEDKYDVLLSAAKDMQEYGVLSQGTLSSLASLDPDSLAEIEEYFEITVDGYTACENALQKYIDKVIEEYVAILAAQEVGSDAYDEAYANLERLLAVFATLALSDQIEEATKALEDQIDALEAEQDALEDSKDEWEARKDAYKEIIDYRKKLLQTFKEELDYQKELEKRQKNVSDLQTKLAVSRLDQSAAGRARTRELEAELQNAQDELEDFTLEHAIEQLTDQMDSEYEEYERFINGKLAEIDDSIDKVKGSIDKVKTEIKNVSGSIAKGAKSLKDKINELLQKYIKNDPPDTPPPDDPPPPETEEPPEDDGSSTSPGEPTADRTDDTFGVFAPNNSGEFNGLVTVAPVAPGEQILPSGLISGSHITVPSGLGNLAVQAMSFVPSSQAGTRNEFNAPLISVECDSVTTESMPKLQSIVDGAVTEIKKQLNDGFSRTGFKSTSLKFPI